MSAPFIINEGDIVRALAVLDRALGRCEGCTARPAVLGDVDGNRLCARCAAGCRYDEAGNSVHATADQVVAAITATMTDDELDIVMDRSQTTRFCRLCGCTENNACRGIGGPCWWVEDNLCSHCQDRAVTVADRVAADNAAKLQALVQACDTFLNGVFGTCYRKHPPVAELEAVLNRCREES